MQKTGLVYAFALALAGASACGGDSPSPVSPSQTGGGTAGAAADGSTLKVTAPAQVQPENNDTTNTTMPNLIVRPSSGRFVPAGTLVYRFAVETAGGAEVYRSSAVADPGTGQIGHRPTEGKLNWGSAYRWRARAEQGSTVGPWSAYLAFQTPAMPAPPLVDEPENGATANGVAPRLIVKNGAVPAGVNPDGLLHRFVVEQLNGTVLATGTAEADDDTTTWVVPADALQETTTYRWRARAERGAAFVGPWSPYWTFTTSSPIVWPTTPGELVGFATQQFPEYLVPTSSLHEREANMAFVRDRMIEAGICGGMDLAWNLKRGVGPRSTDALLHRDGGRDRVIDIAAGFDAYRTPLQLHWVEVEGPPGYDRYLPRPSCK